ncbi:MAG: ribonuclease H-like domain-containing protein [Deltaproteobacteria bacterium]|nr:ribonuclease H-like domain-containing protein [Deltaproteobacteria bacterium]
MNVAQRLRQHLGTDALPSIAAEARPLAGSLARDHRRSGSAERIAQLRAAISRIEGLRSWDAAGTPAERWSALPRQITDRRWAEPAPIDDAGLVYRHVFERDTRFGRAALEAPSRAALHAARHLLRAKLEWTDGDEALGPADLLFIDTETTGLSRAAGTLAFLIGIGRFCEQGKRFIVDQLFVRSPQYEPAVLDLLADYLARAKLLVSFNGRTFDMPILRNRSLIRRVPLLLELPHLDLLPLCRRLLGSRLSNCRLGTVERELFGFVRQDDVDGSLAPELYNAFLRSGSLAGLCGVLEHNRIDIASMAPLFSELVMRASDPLQWAEDGEELFAAARLHLETPGLAERCLQRALQLWQSPATRRKTLETLARLRQRAGDRGEAAKLWHQLLGEFPQYNSGYIELAKHYEHVEKNHAVALRTALAAPHQDLDELPRRIARLQRKLNRAGAPDVQLPAAVAAPRSHR